MDEKGTADAAGRITGRYLLGFVLGVALILAASLIPLLHDPSDTGMEPVYASRSATRQYRTTPLRGLWQHPPCFHDGSAPDLAAVVNHYDVFFGLHLSDRQKSDLVERLKSL